MNQMQKIAENNFREQEKHEKLTDCSMLKRRTFDSSCFLAGVMVVVVVMVRVGGWVGVGRVCVCGVLSASHLSHRVVKSREVIL